MTEFVGTNKKLPIVYALTSKDDKHVMEKGKILTDDKSSVIKLIRKKVFYFPGSLKDQFFVSIATDIQLLSLRASTLKKRSQHKLSIEIVLMIEVRSINYLLLVLD